MEQKVDSVNALVLDDLCRYVLEENLEKVRSILQGNEQLVNMQDKWGWTPMHYVAMRGYEVGLRLLLDFGGNSNLRDSFGDSPLNLAERWGHETIVRILQSEMSQDCPNEGCTFSGKLHELEDHSRECLFRPEQCRLGCELVLPAQEWAIEGRRQQHEEHECSFRVVDCPQNCLKEGLRAKDVDSHITRECIKSLEKSVTHWNEDEVGIWLRQVVHLGQYVDMFREKSVRGNYLTVLNKHHLKDFGIRVRLHIKRIMLAIEEVLEKERSREHAWMYDENFEERQAALRDWIMSVDPSASDEVVGRFTEVLVDDTLLHHVQELDLEKDMKIQNKLLRDLFLRGIPDESAITQVQSIDGAQLQEEEVKRSQDEVTPSAWTGGNLPSLSSSPSSSSSSPPPMLRRNSTDPMDGRTTTSSSSSSQGTDATGTGTTMSTAAHLPRAPNPDQVILEDPTMVDMVIDGDELSPSDWESYSNKLGEGGFGSVYRARFNDFKVAVKIFKGTDSAVRAELLNEAKAALRVSDHENIVSIYGIMLHPLAIVMEFAENGSAWDLLKRSSKRRSEVLATDQLLPRMVFQAARGVSFLHSQDPPIIHRDIAARNMLVTRDFVVKLSDFGLSRSRHYFESRGFTQTNFGPIKYSAPEVLSSKMHEYSKMSDVFSFGVAVYEMATGRPPWEDLDPIAAAQRVLNGFRMEILDEDRVSRELQTLMNRCWAHDSHERPTMEEVAESLSQYEMVTSSRVYDDVEDL